MKNLLTIFILLTIGAATAQDGLNQTPEYYKDIKSKTINIDADAVVQLAIDITANSKYQYSYLSRRLTPKELIITYQKDDIQDPNYVGADNLIFRFTIKNNKYTLYSIRGNWDTVVDLWQRFFLTNATECQIRNNYKYQNLYGQGVYFILSDKNKYGFIENRKR